MQASGGREVALGDENTACLSAFVWDTVKGFLRSETIIEGAHISPVNV